MEGREAVDPVLNVGGTCHHRVKSITINCNESLTSVTPDCCREMILRFGELTI